MVLLCPMSTYSSLKTTSSKRRQMIVVAEINILRKFEDRQLIEDKIFREMRKLHSLWFNGK